MIIFRYLAREITLALASLTSVLLLIFMSNQVMIYLNRAANGQIPGIIVIKIIFLEIPNLLGLLLPLGLYVAIIIGLGRLYLDQEMTVLYACGYSNKKLMQHVMSIAFVIALFVAIIIFFVSPSVAQERAKILRETGLKTMIQTLIPGKFQTLSAGKQVLFVEKISKDHEKANNIFLARNFIKENKQYWDIIFAKKAILEVHSASREYIHLQEGLSYEGGAGINQLKIAQFNDYKARVRHPKISIANDIRTIPSMLLIKQAFADKKIKGSGVVSDKMIELQWRLSVPIMVFILAFLAIPLSKIEPRKKKSAHIFLALILYFVYANMMFVNRGWLLAGTIPQVFGFWWLHSIFIVIALLIWRQFLKIGS